MSSDRTCARSGVGAIVVRTARALTSAIVLFALLFARPAIAQTTDSMPGMSRHAPITIPPGADYTTADVEFMQGMIAHHAQAIYM